MQNASDSKPPELNQVAPKVQAVILTLSVLALLLGAVAIAAY